MPALAWPCGPPVSPRGSAQPEAPLKCGSRPRETWAPLSLPTRGQCPTCRAETKPWELPSPAFSPTTPSLPKAYCSPPSIPCPSQACHSSPGGLPTTPTPSPQAGSPGGTDQGPILPSGSFWPAGPPGPRPPSPSPAQAEHNASAQPTCCPLRAFHRLTLGPTPALWLLPSGPALLQHCFLRAAFLHITPQHLQHPAGRRPKGAGLPPTFPALGTS